MQNILRCIFLLISYIFTSLLLTAETHDPGLKEILFFSKFRITNYDSLSKRVDLEVTIESKESINGIFRLTIFPDANSQNPILSDQQIIINKDGVHVQNISFYLFNDVTTVNINISIPSIAGGYKKNYYRYIKIVKSNTDLLILDPREKTKNNSKQINKKTNSLQRPVENRNLQSITYNVNISGHIKIAILEKGLYGNGVRLYFSNSNNPTDRMHPIVGNQRHVQYDYLDEQGHFSFNFTFTGDLSAYNQAVVLVSTRNDAAWLPAPLDGITDLINLRYYFNESQGVTAPIDGGNSNIVVIDSGEVNFEDGSILRNMQIAREMIIQLYEGNCPFTISSIQVDKTDLNDGRGGEFSSKYWDGLNIVPPLIKIDPDHTTSEIITHEYGHFINYLMWDDDKFDNAGDEIKEGWAIFFSFASQNFMNKVYTDLIDDCSNAEQGPFYPRFFNMMYSDGPIRPAIACYLWNLYDGYTGDNFEINQYNIGDNDDISGHRKKVFETMRSVTLTNVTWYHNEFKVNLSTEERASLDDIYSFMFDDLYNIPDHKMRSAQIKDVNLANISPGEIQFSWTPQNYSSGIELNPPTGYKIYKYVDGAWQSHADIPLGTNYKYLTTGANCSGEYKFSAYNTTGDSYDEIYKQVFTIALSTANYVESGSGGSYLVNGNDVGSWWRGSYFQGSNPITIIPKPPIGYVFVSWSDGDLSNPRTISPSENIDVSAVFKKHLASSTLSATSQSNQRKIVYYGDNYYSVFVSGGYVWHTKYNDENWSSEKLVSSLTNLTAKNPSIAIYWPYVHFVWEEIVNGWKVVCYRRYDENTSTWSNKIDLAIFDGNYDATPVLSTMGYAGKAVVVWKMYDGNPALNGYGTNLKVRLDPLDPTMQTYDLGFIEGKLPSIADPNAQNAYSLTYTNGGGNIDFLQFTLDYYGGSPTIVTQASTISGTNTTCSNPSITKAIDGRIFVSWDALNGTTRHIFARERNSSGVWQTVSEFSHDTHQMSSPSIGIDESANLINVVFNCGDHPARKSRLLSSVTWYNLCSYCQGYNPSLNASGNSYLFWTTGTVVPYAISSANILATPQQPFLTTPSNQQQNIIMTPTLGWNCTIGAAKYQLQISTSPAEYFEDGIILDRLNISSTSYQVTDLNYSTTYYWRVTAVNDIGSSDPSPIWSFTTIPDPFPGPILSGSKVVNGTAYSPKLTWSVVPGATSYVLYRHECGETNDCDDGIDQSFEIVYQGSSLTFTDYSMSVVLKYGTGYVNYIVRAKNALNQMSGRSNKVSFVTYYDIVWKNGAHDGEIPEETRLEASYPNPFNPSTTVRYQIAKASNVSLSIYNQLGQQVALLTNELQEAGYYERSWDAINTPSGMYYLRLLVTDKEGKQLYLNTEKVVVMK
ncbi:MAG: hypothetical protein C0417_11410 [Chlorobiaceae bacterium]|nr:hypothetical protein [Chlorobiaceae bacterium]